MLFSEFRGRITRISLGFNAEARRGAMINTQYMPAISDPTSIRPRRLPLQARSQRRVAHVLDTAARLIDDVGPEAITTGMIAKAAGVSIGWLYDFFPNRESIFDAIVTASLDKVTPVAQAVHEARPNDDWRDVLGAVVEALFDFYQVEPGFRVLWFSRFQSAAMIEVNREHDLAGALDAYERLSRHGLDLVGISPERALHLVIGIIDKGLDLAFRIDPNGDREIVAETIAAVVAYLERYAVR
jgi:AcrR family transcriptional regulator